jgi:NAD(P)-dependent dehydrogenase (short-subunit alcohol dehydrogenase family)
VTNNWNKDTYDWEKEIVVVTGGSDGIGKAIVHLLAEKGIKVAVLDVQKLTYEGK